MSNAELFSTVAREYANFRPGYPPELFAWLARISPSREAVWDCGCGSGQASVALAEHFAVVHATDVAPEQIAAAKPHPRVRYSVAPAEHSGLPDQSVDLVTVAQALHWFDVTAFYAEAARVARPGSAAGGVELSAAAVRRRGARPAILRVLLAGGRAVLAPERRHIEAGYRTLPFPFEEIEAPEFGARARLEPRPGRGLREQLVRHRALSQGAGRRPRAAAARFARAPPGRPTAPACAIRMPLGLRVGKLGASLAESA